MNEKKLIIMILLAVIAGKVLAQEAISASGGEATGSGGTVSYTIGQVTYSSNSGSGVNELQGVQQPYEIFITKINNQIAISGAIDIYPNPTIDKITLSTSEKNNKNLVYQLFDSNGKLLTNAKINENQTQIDMSGLPAATYFIKVACNNEQLKTFKIIKNK